MTRFLECVIAVINARLFLALTSRPSSQSSPAEELSYEESVDDDNMVYDRGSQFEHRRDCIPLGPIILKESDSERPDSRPSYFTGW